MSFLRDYTQFAGGNESPSIYHTWAGLSAIGNFLSRKVWTEMGYFEIHPNMYVLLVGDPGIKKSTAMKLSQRLVIEVGDREIAPASITKEALMLHMGKKDSPCQLVFEKSPGIAKDVRHLCIYANELVTLLNAGGNPMGMIDLLTDIWDMDPYKNVTKNKGSDIIPGPFVSILGCMTPEVMHNLLFQQIISGGFTRRCIFVFADRNEKPVPRPELTQAQKDAWDRCVAKGRELLQWQGAFTWSDEFNEVWIKWYEKNFIAAENSESLVMQGFYRSKAEYVLKLMMLITASESDDSMVLEPPAFHAALAFLEQIEPMLPRIFENTGRNELSPIAGAIERKIISKDEPMKVKTIYAMFYKDATQQEIDGILDHLIKTEQIKAAQITVGGTPVRLVGAPRVIENFISKSPAESKPNAMNLNAAPSERKRPA